jgi:hypothetical protein
LVYDSTVINDSYSVFFSDNIEESKYIYFSYDLKNCTECIFCSNLNSKKYMVYNKQYTESEYLKIKNILKSNTSSYKSLEKLLKDFEELKLNAFRK